MKDRANSHNKATAEDHEFFLLGGPIKNSTSNNNQIGKNT
jgi:hypothetical protein